jgi:hypothetical protein
MHALKTLAAAVAATLTLGACATGGAAPASSFAPAGEAAAKAHASAGARPATLKVENLNWSDMNVYVLQNGARTRLGTVTSMNTTVFRLPAHVLASTANVRLLLDPIGSSEMYLTDPVQVRSGQQIALNVQNSLPLSSVGVWDR